MRLPSEVKKGDLLAKIDDRLYASIVAHDRAALATRNADLARAQAELQKAKNVEQRANALRAEDETFIAQAELDEVMFSRLSLEALCAKELQRLGIDPSKVTRIYSELQPCHLPGAFCEKFIRQKFPQAEVTWSFEYGVTVESRRAGVKALRAVQE